MKINTNPQKVKEVLERGVERIYPNLASLQRRMRKGERLKVYCGYDPTTPSLHIGHMITLKKLAQFQGLGHEVIMLLGDFTGMIGDPSEKMAVRQKLSRKQVLANARNYKQIASKVLKFSGPNPAKVLYNSKWSDKLSFIDLIELSSHFTVQQMITRDMFQRRIKQKKPIFLHEFLYPLAQAYDSVAMDVDLEVGGNDQIFNMLAGRSLMKALKKKEKFVLATKLLTDPSGKKMGKTEGRIVDMTENPGEMYGQIMSWPDSSIIIGLELCTDLPMKGIKKMEKEIKTKKLNPREAKAKLAREIVAICHSKKEAQQAEKAFNKVFRERGLPSEIPRVKIKEKTLPIIDLLVKTKTASSKSEARRLIGQKGVKIEGKVQDGWKKRISIKKGMIVQVGKRKFAKIT